MIKSFKDSNVHDCILQQAQCYFPIVNKHTRKTIKTSHYIYIPLEWFLDNNKNEIFVITENNNESPEKFTKEYKKIRWSF
jgi:hypothetical protein